MFSRGVARGESIAVYSSWSQCVDKPMTQIGEWNGRLATRRSSPRDNARLKIKASILTTLPWKSGTARRFRGRYSGAAAADSVNSTNGIASPDHCVVGPVRPVKGN